MISKELLVLGLPLQLTELDVKNMVPLVFMGEYDFFKGKIIDKEFLVLYFKGNYLSIPRLQKHFKILRTSLGLTDACVLWLDKLSPARRERLIENSIPFFVDEKMVFLPFLGTQLESRKDAPLKSIPEKLTTAAQCVFLWILHNKALECPTDQIMNDLKLSQATVSRALILLMQYGLVTFKGKGTRKKYFRIEAKQFWDTGKKYIRNPVKKRLFMEETTPLQSIETYTAGEAALAEISMLETPEHQCKAVYKEHFNKLKRSAVTSADMLRTENYVIVELWSYDPGLFAKLFPHTSPKSGIVDIFSLYASLGNLIEDVRVEKELDKLMEDFFNG